MILGCAEASAMNKKIEKYWTEQIKSANLSEKEFERWQERKKLDRECSVRQEIEWIRQAGFKSAECIYLNGKFAVIIARK